MVRLLNDVLVFKRNESADIKLVVPYTLRHRLFNASHWCPLAAHLGSYCMTQELKTNYFWPGVRKDIKNGAKNVKHVPKAVVHHINGMELFKRLLLVHH